MSRGEAAAQQSAWVTGWWSEVVVWRDACQKLLIYPTCFTSVSCTHSNNPGQHSGSGMVQCPTQGQRENCSVEVLHLKSAAATKKVWNKSCYILFQIDHSFSNVLVTDRFQVREQDVEVLQRFAKYKIWWINQSDLMICSKFWPYLTIFLRILWLHSRRMQPQGSSWSIEPCLTEGVGSDRESLGATGVRLRLRFQELRRLLDLETLQTLPISIVKQ